LQSQENTRKAMSIGAAQGTPISHSSNRICTRRTETGVAAWHQFYAVTWNQ